MSPKRICASCIDDVTSLKEAGKLCSPDTSTKTWRSTSRTAATVVKALCLHVAHTCNLNCAYCFASQGKLPRGPGADEL